MRKFHEDEYPFHGKKYFLVKINCRFFNAGRCYKKSWIAMGLTFFLVIVLLIALIIVASTNSTPPRTESDCETEDRLTGNRPDIKSIPGDIVVMLDTTTPAAEINNAIYETSEDIGK